MTLRAEVAPRLLEWAVVRSGRGLEYLGGRFPKLRRWLDGDERPTFKQLESFAEATYTPIGYLFLTQPPAERLPIPDLRTVRDTGVNRPSANLLDTIYDCQIRQDWFRGWAASQEAAELPFVGSLTTEARPVDAARLMHQTVAFYAPASRDYRSWGAAVTGLADSLGNAGILVMINGVVGTDTHRVLDPEEFRGFALSDSLAPLVFINGADSKAAQLFTLAHESAHLWIATSGVDNPGHVLDEGADVERWCNAVAAEFLVPLADLELVYNRHRTLNAELDELARRYRVSRLAALVRLHEAGFLDWDTYRATFEEEVERARQHAERRRGGNFYSTLSSRVGKRFLRAVIDSTRSGETLYSDAFRMLGVKQQRVFDEIPARLRLS